MHDMSQKISETNITKAVIETSIDLNESEKQVVAQYIRKHFPKVNEIDYKISDGHIGGFRVIAADYVIDMTLKSDLGKLVSALKI